MTPCFTTTIDAFLRNHAVMSMATCAQGQLWSASLIYCLDQEYGSLVYYTDPRTLHGTLSVIEPVVSATIAPQVQDFTQIQGLQLSGTTRALQGEERDRAVKLFSAQYPAVGDTGTPIWALTPHYIKLVDNTIAFGHKEIWGNR